MFSVLVLAAVACDEGWEIGFAEEFTGTGTTFPDDHIPVYLPEGRYMVEPSPNLTVEEFAYVTLLRKVNGSQWTWSPSNNIIYATYSSIPKLFPGEYELRVPALESDTWSITITRIQDLGNGSR